MTFWPPPFLTPDPFLTKPLDGPRHPVVQANTPMKQRALINLLNWWWRGERLGLPGTHART
jgi:hypothetical protein